jgi:colicin import membrane protein
MSGSDVEHPELSKEETQHQQDSIIKRVSDVSGASASILSRDHTDFGKRVKSQNLALKLRRFSDISSDMVNLVSDLSREVSMAMEQLRELREEAELRKKELRAFHDIEVSAAEIEQLLEAHREQKEGLERLLESHRSILKEEKAKRMQEEREYLENREMLRRREEEEYRKRWAEEESKAKRGLEEELRMIQRQNLEKQEVLAKNLRQREQQLKERELEWTRLIQELEEFMSKLTTRIQS